VERATDLTAPKAAHKSVIGCNPAPAHHGGGSILSLNEAGRRRLSTGRQPAIPPGTARVASLAMAAAAENGAAALGQRRSPARKPAWVAICSSDPPSALSAESLGRGYAGVVRQTKQSQTQNFQKTTNQTSTKPDSPPSRGHAGARVNKGPDRHRLRDVKREERGQTCALKIRRRRGRHQLMFVGIPRIGQSSAGGTVAARSCPRSSQHRPRLATLWMMPLRPLGAARERWHPSVGTSGSAMVRANAENDDEVCG